MTVLAVTVLATGYTLGVWLLFRQAQRRDTLRRARRWYAVTSYVIPLPRRHRAGSGDRRRARVRRNDEMEGGAPSPPGEGRGWVKKCEP